MKATFCKPLLIVNKEAPDLYLLSQKEKEGKEIDLCGYCPISGRAFELGYREYVFEYRFWLIRMKRSKSGQCEAAFHLKTSLEHKTCSREFSAKDLFELFAEIKAVAEYLEFKKVLLSATDEKRHRVYIALLKRMGYQFEELGFPELSIFKIIVFVK